MSHVDRSRYDELKLRLRLMLNATMPMWLREPMLGCVHCVSAWLAPVPVVRLTGRFRGSGDTGTAIVAGHHETLRYWCDALFSVIERKEHLASQREPFIRSVVAAHRDAADITLVRADAISSALWGDDYLCVPEWVGVRADVPRDIDAMRRLSDSGASDMRITKRGGLQCDVSGSGEDLAEFYEDFYAPFSLARYGPDTFVPPLSWLRQRRRGGAIIWVKVGDQRVCGMLVQLRGRTLDLLALGVRGGDLDLARSGSMAAAYVHTIRYAMDVGALTLDFRGCRASLMDGVLRYKRKWGGALYRKRENVYHRTLMYWPRANSGVRGFLSQTVPIFLTGRKMCCVSAFDGDATEEALRQTERTVSMPGLDRMVVLAPTDSMGMRGAEDSTMLLPENASSSDVLDRLAKP